MFVRRPKVVKLIPVLLFLFVTSGQYAFAQNDRQLTREKADAKRIALVIGNGNYVSARKLENPANDAEDMAKTLRGLDFEVISGTNLSLREMTEKVREFGDRLRTEKGIGLVYYAGHGVQVGGNNYLIPVDADIPREDEVKYTSLDLNFVLEKMATANNGLNIVILDACRNNPFERGWSRSADSGGLAQVTAPTGTFIAYSTAPNMTASDGDGRNGLYTAELLRELKKPGLKIEEAFKQVTIAVDKKSGGKQIPWTSSSLRGEFYFAGSEGAADPVSGEEAFWRSVENSTDEKEVEGYLNRVRAGEFAGTYKAAAEVTLYRLKKAGAIARWESIRADAKALMDFAFVSPSFSEGLAKVMVGPLGEFGQGEGQGFVDRTGRVVIPPRFKYAEDFSEGLAAASLDGNTKGYIDKTGNFVIEPSFELASPFSQGLAAVRVDGLWGYIDKSGKLVIPHKFGLANQFSEGLAAVYENGTWGFIDPSGNKITSFAEKDVSVERYSEGLASIRRGQKWGYIDKSGREVIPAIYDLAYSFSDGIARVDLPGKGWGVIDKAGNELFKGDYTALAGFSDGLALVVTGGMPTMSTVNGVRTFYTEPRKVGFVDKTGKLAIPLNYYDARPFSQGLALVSNDEKWGLIDRFGSVVLPIRYDEVWCRVFAADGIYGVMLNGRKGFVDIYGNEFFDF